MTVYEGDIVTCDNNNSIYKYLVEDKGKILYVGEKLPEEYKKSEKIILGAKALLPSFCDTHIHYSSYSLFASLPDIRGLKSIDEILQFLKESEKTNKLNFILSFGASAHGVAEKRLILKEEIDKIFPDKPVMIIKYDGHACIVNGRMLEVLPDKIKSIRGFHFDTGELNQEAFFFATDFITGKIPTLNLIGNMVKGIDRLAEKGIGMIHTVEGVGFPKDMDVDLAVTLAKGLRNPFQMRIFFQTMDILKVTKRKLPRIGGCFATALDGC
ncbi:MAG TPA: amidohydrolase family protein, partial [Spirochaetota bacterium]|nr:amidohydrolase family protein [Spirochaetota bacterium]